MLHCVAVSYSVLQCVSACCSMLQCVAQQGTNQNFLVNHRHNRCKQTLYLRSLSLILARHAFAFMRAARCNTLQHAATRCATHNTLNTQQHTATCCNTRAPASRRAYAHSRARSRIASANSGNDRNTHCNTLQHTVRHTATHTATHTRIPAQKPSQVVALIGI